jgi:hypothetical protein
MAPHSAGPLPVSATSATADSPSSSRLTYRLNTSPAWNSPFRAAHRNSHRGQKRRTFSGEVAR